MIAIVKNRISQWFPYLLLPCLTLILPLLLAPTAILLVFLVKLFLQLSYLDAPAARLIHHPLHFLLGFQESCLLAFVDWGREGNVGLGGGIRKLNYMSKKDIGFFSNRIAELVREPSVYVLKRSHF